MYLPDQGTTGLRAIIFNHQGDCNNLSKDFQQYFPKLGWVEHDRKYGTLKARYYGSYGKTDLTIKT